MKIFMKWWPKKSGTVGRNRNATGAAASTTSSTACSSALPATHLQHPDQPCGVSFLDTQPVHDDPEHTASLPHSFNRNHDNKSLQDMMCPIYSSDLVHYKKAMENNPDVHTDASTKNYDLELLIYQYTLQNAILSIGTLGGEFLTMQDEEIAYNEIATSTVAEAPSVDNNSLDVVKHENYFTQLSTTQKHASRAGDECVVRKDEIHINGPTASNTSNGDAVGSNEEILRVPISRIQSSDEVQVEMLRPLNNADDKQQKLKCTKSTIYSTFINATLQQELKKEEDKVHQPARIAVNYPNRINYHNVGDEMSENQQLLTFMCGELDVKEKLVNGHVNMKSINKEEDVLINNEVNVLKSTYMMEEFLKGLYMIEEVAQQENITGDDEARKCGSDQGGGMGPCRNTKENMMESSRNAQGASMRNSTGIIMGSCTHAAQGSLGSSSSSKNTQGIMGSSTYTNCAQGNMIQDASSSCAQEKISSSTYRVEGIKGFDIQASIATVSTKPTKNSTVVKAGDEEGDNENMATHKYNCLKLASTCNHHMDLKRLIVAVTPNYLAKHLLKRLRLGHRQMQMGRPADCNYQCKFDKLLRMLRIKQSRRGSNIMKRELGPLIAVHDAQMTRKEDIDHYMEDEQDSSLQNLAEGSFSNHSNENWISTDDECVHEIITTWELR